MKLTYLEVKQETVGLTQQVIMKHIAIYQLVLMEGKLKQIKIHSGFANLTF